MEHSVSSATTQDMDEYASLEPSQNWELTFPRFATVWWRVGRTGAGLTASVMM